MRMCSILCTSHKIEKLKLQYGFLSSLTNWRCEQGTGVKGCRADKEVDRAG